MKYEDNAYKDLKNGYRIRKSSVADLPQIREIFKSAREYMKDSGNPHQWNDGYPDDSQIMTDIKNRSGYVILDSAGIAGVFTVAEGEDPYYKVIENGAWLNEDPYVTVHRIAKRADAKDVFGTMFRFCSSLYGNIRIDTHMQNRAMRRKITQYGFEECGTVFVRNGSPRIAYQWCRKAENKMYRVRITVMRKASYPDLSGLYEKPQEHPCDLEEGMSFISVRGEMPECFCKNAWDTVGPFVKALAEGKQGFYGEWMKNPRSAMISCNDGFRPVSFLLEVIE